MGHMGRMGGICVTAMIMKPSTEFDQSKFGWQVGSAVANTHAITPLVGP
jgi:hypothetical protein